MKKRKMTIEECENPLGSYTITINNARYQKNFSMCIRKVLKHLLTEKDLFFGLYRIDGLNLTRKEEKKLKNEIPSFFKKYGEIQIISEYLSVARINAKSSIYDFMPLIFDYYLETTVFNPKVDWETFKQYHSDYQKHKTEEIILNGFAEIQFFYFDSGDFSICFNPKVYDLVDIRNIINMVFEGTEEIQNMNTGDGSMC